LFLLTEKEWVDRGSTVQGGIIAERSRAVQALLHGPVGYRLWTSVLPAATAAKADRADEDGR
jgi:hypothetical protein